VFKNDQIRSEFFARASQLVRARYYIEKEVEKGALLLIEWMKSQGYLAAKLVTINRAYDEKRKSVSLVIYLYEGDQTVIQG
ncbi:hypothetical protein, partial [Escherichia coli]|uniref:hypothetical protein n=1 Tax=Escherichia coli TaxID=562 RepID=UPI000D476780